MACGDDPTPPEPLPGDLLVTIVSPNGVEGSAVLETVDERIAAVTAEGAQIFHRRAGGLSRVVILLDVAGDLRFRLSVADQNNPPRLQIVEVAGADNGLRANLAGYVVTAEPVTGA
jgi:hypothetical protein